MENIQSELDTLKANPKSKDTSSTETVEVLAKKYGVNKDFLKELYGLMPKQKVSDEDLQLIKDLKDDMQTKKASKAFESKYVAEFKTLKKENPSLDSDDINTIKLKKLKTEYPDTPLSILFKAYKDSVIIAKGKRTLETSSKEMDSSKVEVKGLSEIEALKLSDADFEKWSNAKEKGDSFLKK